MTFEKILACLAIVAGALLALAGSYLAGNYFEQQLAHNVPVGQLLFSAAIILIGAAVFTAALKDVAQWTTE